MQFKFDFSEIENIKLCFITFPHTEVTKMCSSHSTSSQIHVAITKLLNSLDVLFCNVIDKVAREAAIFVLKTNKSGW